MKEFEQDWSLDLHHATPLGWVDPGMVGLLVLNCGRVMTRIEIVWMWVFEV